MMNNLIKVSSYALQKGVSVTAVYNWIRSGKVDAEKIDGVWFIKIDTVNE